MAWIAYIPLGPTRKYETSRPTYACGVARENCTAERYNYYIRAAIETFPVDTGILRFKYACPTAVEFLDTYTLPFELVPDKTLRGVRIEAGLSPNNTGTKSFWSPP